MPVSGSRAHQAPGPPCGGDWKIIKTGFGFKGADKFFCLRKTWERQPTHKERGKRTLPPDAMHKLVRPTYDIADIRRAMGQCCCGAEADGRASFAAIYLFRSYGTQENDL